MFLLLQLAAVIGAVSANDLRFLSTPQSIKLPVPSSASTLDSASLALLNKNLLGLSAQTPSGFSVETSLFSRPRALTIVQITGIDLPTDGNKYSIAQNGDGNEPSVEEALAIAFGADRESVTLSGSQITGTALAQQVQEQKVDGTAIKTKLTALRTELENVYALAAAIKASGAKFNKDSVDLYRININSLAGLDMTAEEKATATSDINAALDQLTKALSTVYGDQIIVEVLTLSKQVNPAPGFNASGADSHVIRKRDTTDEEKNDPTVKARIKYNVSVMVSNDYPAIFAIFAGLVIALVLAVLYTTVGMMTMDPGKDSIIYRMTTTRMKKD